MIYFPKAASSKAQSSKTKKWKEDSNPLKKRIGKVFLKLSRYLGLALWKKRKAKPLWKRCGFWSIADKQVLCLKGKTEGFELYRKIFVKKVCFDLFLLLWNLFKRKGLCEKGRFHSMNSRSDLTGGQKNVGSAQETAWKKQGHPHPNVGSLICNHRSGEPLGWMWNVFDLQAASKGDVLGQRFFLKITKNSMSGHKKRSGPYST